MLPFFFLPHHTWNKQNTMSQDHHHLVSYLCKVYASSPEDEAESTKTDHLASFQICSLKAKLSWVSLSSKTAWCLIEVTWVVRMAVLCYIQHTGHLSLLKSLNLSTPHHGEDQASQAHRCEIGLCPSKWLQPARIVGSC